MISPEVSRALGVLYSATRDRRRRDQPGFDVLSRFIQDFGIIEPSWNDDDPSVLAAFADNPDRVEQIRKLAPFLKEAGYRLDVAGAAETLGFTFP